MMNRNEIFSQLESAQISRVEIEFSGGNDEGFVDGTYFITTDGQQLDKNDYRVQNLKEVEDLYNPIWDEYGSFAGEFYVHGLLIWDVQAKKVYFKGEEEEKTYTPFEKEV